jgi:hypothetical protein
MAGVSGDFAALKKFAKGVDGLKNATKYIAAAAAPKIAARATLQINGQETPYGEAWIASKSGKPVLQGTAADVSVRLKQGGRAIRISIGYPLAFHNDGTRRGGKKTAARLRAAQKARGALRGSWTAQAKRNAPPPPPKQRERRTKGEEFDAFAFARRVRAMEERAMKRLATFKAKQALRAKLKAQVDNKIAGLRGMVHDPRRPIIPNEDEGIPDAWRGDVLDAARAVMAAGGATLKAGS